MFIVSHHVGLIGPIKCRPHFIKGSFRSVVTSLAKFFIFSPPIFWQLPQLLQHSWVSLNKVGHQQPTSKNFFAMIFATNCPPTAPSCRSFRIIYAFEVVKHLCILLSCPILYIVPSFKVKGFAFLANFCFKVKFRFLGCVCL